MPCTSTQPQPDAPSFTMLDMLLKAVEHWIVSDAEISCLGQFGALNLLAQARACAAGLAQQKGETP